MKNKPIYWNTAIKVLSQKDKVLKRLIKKYDDKVLTSRKDIFSLFAKV